MVRLALTVAGERCPEGAVPLIVARAVSGSNTDQRVTAIRVLGATSDAGARLALLQLTAPRRGMFGPRPPAKTPEYLAALAALHRHAADPKVAAVLADAQRAKDPDVARAAGGARAEGE
jgi:hypothetical protein